MGYEFRDKTHGGSRANAYANGGAVKAKPNTTINIMVAGPRGQSDDRPMAEPMAVPGPPPAMPMPPPGAMPPGGPPMPLARKHGGRIPGGRARRFEQGGAVDDDSQRQMSTGSQQQTNIPDSQRQTTSSGDTVGSLRPTGKATYDPSTGRVKGLASGGRIPHMGEAQNATAEAFRRAQNKKGFASGGRVHTYPKMKYGAESGEGRLAKIAKYGDKAK